MGRHGIRIALSQVFTREFYTRVTIESCWRESVREITSGGVKSRRYAYAYVHTPVLSSGQPNGRIKVELCRSLVFYRWLVEHP